MLEEFKKSSKSEWVDLLTKELKGADLKEFLIKTNHVEEVQFPSFFHSEDFDLSSEKPGDFPYKRGFNFELNDWDVVSKVKVFDDKSANKTALKHLMEGSNAIYFDFSENIQFDLNLLFDKIEFAYISVYFETSEKQLIQQIKNFFIGKKTKEIIFINKNSCVNDAKNKIINNQTIIRNCTINAYSVQQIGANCGQEIAYCLFEGHNLLFEGIKSNINKDEIVKNIHFLIGVGSNFLFEIAKIRALRLCWSKIIKSYFYEDNFDALNIKVTAQIGFLNKSLKDPYTNLLRQSTEVMSAVLGGANAVINQAYDFESENGSSDFSERMATNISLILKEESYFNQVLDAIGGSYAIEFLTNELADKAWNIFQKLQNKENIESTFFIEEVKKTRELRIKDCNEKNKKMIGINHFFNPENVTNSWKNSSNLIFGLSPLVLEKEI